jgi:hypothetical protein
MLTTLCSYGNVPPERQAEILKRQRLPPIGPNDGSIAQPDAGTVQSVLAHIAKNLWSYRLKTFQ